MTTIQACFDAAFDGELPDTKAFHKFYTSLHPRAQEDAFSGLEAAWSPAFQAHLQQAQHRPEPADASPAAAPPDVSLQALVAEILRRALAVNTILPDGMPTLHQNAAGSVQLSRDQAACILCCMFLSLSPLGLDPDTHPAHVRFCPGFDHTNSPGASFYQLLRNERSQEVAKLQCFLLYFHSLLGAPPSPEPALYFERTVVPADSVDWSGSNVPLCKLECRVGSIHDAADCLQVDFANQNLGGGVLRRGSVQEEIMFAVRPELTAGLAFTQRMLPHEAVAICGARCYSQTEGYASTLRFSGAAPQPLREASAAAAVVAIDAVRYPKRDRKAQLRTPDIQRELLKAYAGFCAGGPCSREAFRAVATGNWGCGAFNGFLPLKATLQWMAASQAQRDVVYYPFDQAAFGERLAEVCSRLITRGATVGAVYRALMSHLGQMEAENSDFFGLLEQGLAEDKHR